MGGGQSPAPASHLQVLDLTANRLRHLEGKLLALTGLRRLCLRQNLVTSTAEVEQLASTPGLCGVYAGFLPPWM